MAYGVRSGFGRISVKVLLATAVLLTPFTGHAGIILTGSFIETPNPGLLDIARPSAASFNTEYDGVAPRFSWDNAPFSAYFEFTATSLFDVSLESYSPTDQSSNVSAVTLDLLDASGGSALDRLTTQTSFCNAAGTLVSGTCDLVTGSSNTGSNADAAAKPGDSLFNSLDAGFYRLGFYESGSPSSGRAVIGLDSSAVPVPATLALFGLGLAGLGYSRRKKA